MSQRQHLIAIKELSQLQGRVRLPQGSYLRTAAKRFGPRLERRLTKVALRQEL